MTVLVGYLPERGGRGALDLGVQLAGALGVPLIVATVVPRPWSTPSLARVDAEYAAFAAQIGQDAERRGADYLASTAPGIDVAFRSVTGRSVATALIDAAVAVEASCLVLGSSSEGRLGYVSIGSTASRLLHSSPVPVALSPRGYRLGSRVGIDRISCAFSDLPASVDVVRAAEGLSHRVSVPLRVLTFGVRQGSMYPPAVGLSIEDAVLNAWAQQAGESQRALVEGNIIGADVDTVVAQGADWGDAVDAVDWLPAEILVVGSSSVSPIAQVFLGSRATKLVRHAPVPVLVVAGTPAP